VAHIEARKTERPAGSGQVTAARAAVIEEAGSGVVFRHRGRLFVITNYHVVDGARLEDIRLAVDDRYVKATDIRHDAESDLSVILLDETDLEPARLGDSGKVEIGEFVVVIGSPFGLSHSVSYGIISAGHRRDLELGPQGVIYQDFFQTDAAINPGNSGGPLLNLNGEVIGINTAIASNSGGSDGIGFAIPVNMALRIVTDLIDHGFVRRGYLGVSLDSNFTAEVAQSLGLRRRGGARITAVSPGSPAAAADLQTGDVVLDFGGTPVGSDSHLVTIVSLARIGDTVPMTIWRNGQSFTANIQIRQKEAAGG
jgi:serine protease Do